MFLNKEDFNIKLVDFGLAFCWDEDLKTELRQKGLHKIMTGTVNYLPYSARLHGSRNACTQL